MKGFGQLMATIGVLVVIGSLMYGLSAGSPGGFWHAVGTWGLRTTIVVALAFVLCPPFGSLVTLTVAEMVRRLGGERAVERLLIGLRALYWILLLGSLALPPVAHYRLDWPVWPIVYAYSAVVGVLLGGLTFLPTLMTEVRSRISAAAWRP